MSRAGTLITVAVPYVWLAGAGRLVPVAPLEFRAPGVTLPLELGIGRLVLRALYLAEIALAALLAATGAAAGMPGAGWGLLVVLRITGGVIEVALPAPTSPAPVSRGPR